MKYNERIREIREDNSLTQQKIADLLHIGQRTYSDYESGKTRIPIDNLLILAKFYDVSLDYITGASNIKTAYPKKWVCEIKSVNRHSMISDGAVSSWNELAALVYITSI